MIVLLPFHEPVRELATAAELSVRRQSFPVECRRVFCTDDGVVPEWDFCVRPGLPYVTCNHLFTGCVNRLPLGTTFLWLEPDAVLTRPTSLRELQDAFDRACKDKPDLCVFGHDKSDQWDKWAFYAGCSVYRVTPTLRDAVRAISPVKPHDQELGKILRGTQYAEHTPLIRCVWQYDSEGALGIYEKDIVNVLDRHPEAAMIHGDKSRRLDAVLAERGSK